MGGNLVHGWRHTDCKAANSSVLINSSETGFYLRMKSDREKSRKSSCCRKQKDEKQL